MKHFFRFLILTALFSLILSACSEDEQPEDTATPPPVPTLADRAISGEPSDADAPASASQLVISEILVGIPGNNNYEFIEIYNPTTQAVDLRGWTLMYQLPDRDPVEIYRWTRRADIPALGHFLLVRDGQDVGQLGDAFFTDGLFRKGGLVLLNREDEVIDQVGWDEAPADYVAGSPISPAEDGTSYERAPGGLAGNGQNSGDNAADFINSAPNPQNSGSLPTPLPEGFLAITLGNPEMVTPGDSFDFIVSITNESGQDAAELLVAIPLHPAFEVIEAPAGAEIKADRVEFPVSALANGETYETTIAIATPLTYFSTTLPGYYVEANGLRSYGPVGEIALAGGSLPVANARGLDGATVTVEGVVTMYTGGFFAGSGTKFYVEDETGGIQVYCPTAQYDDIQIGDVVQVTGYIEIYRTSVELIPCEADTDIVVVVGEADAPTPLQVPLATLGNDPLLLGELLSVNGTVTRLEEFSFSYEMDITDEAGGTLLVYIDKQTGIDGELLEVGQTYDVIGIYEQWDGNFRLMPRQQSDFVTQFAPVVVLSLTAPFSAPAGSTISYSYTATNYTGNDLADISFTFNSPLEREADFVWTIPTLTANESSTVSYELAIPDGISGTLTLPAPLDASLVPDQLQMPGDHLIYIGDGVPIWALQGSGPESPYIREIVTTSGVITAIFPALNGFWLQMSTGDGDSSTSDAVFVLTENERLTLEPLMTVQVTGKMREIAGQTTLDIAAGIDVTVTGMAESLPTAIELIPPADVEAAQLYLETLEGMLVQVSEPALAVGPTTQYGEFALVRAETGAERIYRSEDIGYLIFVDDGSTIRHVDQATLPYVIYSGDEVSGVIGPLAYTFGQFKIEPIQPPIITPAERALPAPLRIGANQFSIATFNVENLFDTSSPHPDSPPFPTPQEYQDKLDKITDAIVTMGAPTILGLQEVENTTVLEDIAAQPSLQQYNYQAVLIEGDDSRGIDVGYLIRGDQVELLSVASFPAPEGVTSRHPLVMEVMVTVDTGSVKLFLINNHFTSLAGGEEATEPRRTAQAAWNVTLLAEIQSREPDALVAIMGDMNSYYNSLPIDTIREAGMIHVYEGNIDADRLYSYIFEGESETLDHILVTPGLFALMEDVEAIHINADFPIAIAGDTSAQRSSDHDPIVAIFTIP